MEREDIEKKVNRIIVDILGVEPEEVKPEAELIYDLGCDSLDDVEILMKLEEEFSLQEISFDRANQCKTVRDVYNMVEELI